jgi:hypothetical protein
VVGGKAAVGLADVAVVTASDAEEGGTVSA